MTKYISRALMGTALFVLHFSFLPTVISQPSAHGALPEGIVISSVHKLSEKEVATLFFNHEAADNRVFNGSVSVAAQKLRLYTLNIWLQVREYVFTNTTNKQQVFSPRVVMARMLAERERSVAIQDILKLYEKSDLSERVAIAYRVVAGLFGLGVSAFGSVNWWRRRGARGHLALTGVGGAMAWFMAALLYKDFVMGRRIRQLGLHLQPRVMNNGTKSHRSLSDDHIVHLAPGEACYCYGFSTQK